MFARRARSADWISWLRHPAFAGAIGMTRLPGIWFNPLSEDLATIRAAGATTLVTLVERHELRWAGSQDFGGEVAHAGLVWHHLPIADFGVPDAAFEHAWRTVGVDLRARLLAGERLVIHCYAGLGRTGLLAARLLVEFGERPAHAIALVRAVRAGTIQTGEQEAHLLRQAGSERWRETG